MPPAPEPSTTEELFAAWLDRAEAGEPVDFGAFCACHPEHAEDLRAVHAQWRAMARAFDRLSTADAARTAPAASASLDALKQRLGTPGARLARYALRAEIARGAMGRIVRAWDEELRREVALKIQRSDAADTRQQRRFLEEAQIAAQLDHPGIVPVHELGLDADGRPFFSMQLVRGHDLGKVLQAVRDGRDGWTRTRVLEVLLRVCDAMAFAHDRGVVHRDLKPANIMVGRYGETYVMDWGLARVHGAAEPATAAESVDTLRREIASEGSDSALLTGHTDVVGTPAYMAPEQAAGGADATAPAVDVYALGAILYHLLGGDAPYGGTRKSSDAVLHELRAGPPPALASDVPPELRAICERAMARLPRDRYANTTALADDLRAFLEVRTVSAYATGRFAELKKWVARNRTLAAVAGALAVALVGGALAVTTFWLRAERDRERADTNAANLLAERDRNAFRAARQSLQLDNSADAADTLWRTHLLGRMPRATSWALLELAEHDPYLATVPFDASVAPVAFVGSSGDVLVGGTDGRLQLREPVQLVLRTELGNLGVRITAVTAVPAAAAGGDLAIAGTAKGEIAVFELATGRLITRTPHHRGSVRNLVATGGASFASSGQDGRVLWWKDATSEPRELLQLDGEATALAAYSRGQGVVAGAENGSIRGVAVDNSWKFEFKTGFYVTALAFGQIGPELWIGGTDHQLRFLDLLNRKNDRTEPTRNGTCRQLVRDRDGALILGGWWRTDRVSATGAALGPLALRSVTRMAIDSERRRLVTTDPISGLGIIDIEPKHRRTLPNGALALSADGKRYARFDGDRIVVRDVDSDAVVATTAAGYAGSRIRLDATGSHLAIATTRPARVEVLDLATGTQTCNSQGPADDPFSEGFVFSRQGEFAVIVGTSAVRRMRAADGEALAEYLVPGARLTRLGYSADGRWLAAIRRGEATVRVFDCTNGEWRDEAFRDLATGVTLSAVALSTNGTLAIGTWQGGIVVRTRDGGTQLLPGHAGTVRNLQFVDSDPRLLFSCGGSGGFAAWDLATMECCYQALDDVVSQLQVSSDASTLACTTTSTALLVDLTYRRRHVAGNLDYQLTRLRGKLPIDAAREAELRAWATAELGKPWPRWR